MHTQSSVFPAVPHRERSCTALTFFAGLAALLVSLHAALAHAAAPQVGTQGPGFYRMMLGSYEITALLDGTHPFPVDTVMTDVPRRVIDQDLAEDDLALPLQGSINAFLINTGSQLILIDTGAGVLYGDCCGHLLANLRAAGYQPEQVDQVLLTHMHKDHVGGVIRAGQMAFPNAVLRVSQREADYWLDAGNKKTAPSFLSSFFDSAAQSVAPYIAAGRFRPFDGDATIAPGVSALATPGHTPAHTGYVVKSGQQTLIVWGDIIHVAAIQLRDPRASVEYDSDAAAARQSRLALLDRAAREHDVIAAAHISFPGLGHVRKEGGSYVWIPLNYDADPASHAATAVKAAP
ncbi:beta-lactamase domain protein [Paraburkholderia atlantica]|uniref:Beta-lactamase domain protein n=1 Tax=Paraburkholderia atlantica TaxID=2654982 RepID=D5WDU9_PARAM|nr:MBL fold metallo-hydrolase [Paraburkholderia atlantica]ADG18902.1 beta-lactamase domain protein [Paraburkholderia atlantica]